MLFQFLFQFLSSGWDRLWQPCDPERELTEEDECFLNFFFFLLRPDHVIVSLSGLSVLKGNINEQKKSKIASFQLLTKKQAAPPWGV